MPKSLIQPSGLSAVMDYLADREALVGEARAAFLQLLKHHFHYRDFSQPAERTLWVVAATLAGLTCLALDWWYHHENLSAGRWAAWAFWSGVGIVLARHFTRPTRADPDLDLQWIVYCQVVRPVILREHPGLLDRDAEPALAVRQYRMPSLGASFKVARDARPAQWGKSSLVGMWVGMASLLGWHLIADPADGWLMLLPFCGLLAGPWIWAGLQWVALRWLANDDDAVM